MASLINSNRSIGCKDGLGGIKAFYIARFVDYRFSKFTFDTIKNIAAFPTTEVLKFNLNNSNNSYSESFNGESYKQSLNVVFPKQTLEGNRQLNTLSILDYRFIIETNTGLFKLLGLENGLSTVSFDSTTGGGISDMNGTTMQFEGNERLESPFIEDLEGVGFTIVDRSGGYTFQDVENFLFQDGIDYDFN